MKIQTIYTNRINPLRKHRSRRKIIGKIDPVTGEVVPTNRHQKRKAVSEGKSPSSSAAKNAGDETRADQVVTVIVGFMLRGDHLGVTSVIRDLSLSPGCYELLIHFFHSAAWDPEMIRKTWWKLLAERAPV